MYARLRRILTALCCPPFHGLWFVVLFYYAWCYFLFPHSAIVRGDLPDTDDYMYLNQVLDWLKGQGWYDNIQHRLDPPLGVPIHFSRLTQLPMAAIIMLLERCGLGPRGAATLMAVIYPLILFAGFFASIRWLAGRFMPPAWAGVTAFVTLFATTMTFLFQPGHVDHHGLVLILMVLTIGSALRMMERPEQYHWGICAGLLMAFALTVALEVLPWLLLISGWLGLWAIVKGGKAALNSLAYALALYLGSFLTLALTRPLGTLFVTDVLTYSLVYVILTGGIAVGFAALALTAGRSVWIRWIVGSVLAAFLSFPFLHHFPDLITGPYGGMDPALAQIILGEISEAQPLKLPVNTWFQVSRTLATALLAFVTGLWFLYQSRVEERWRWGLLMFLLLAALALTTFYQRRFMGMMGTLSIVPLAVLLQRGWIGIGKRLQGRPRIYAEIGLLLLIGPLPSVLYPALIDGRSFNTGVLLFPATLSQEAGQCDMYDLEELLRDPVYYGDRPRLIMSTIGMGPELLFRSNHTVLSAPYHMDVEGNLDATRFFSTPYPEEAEAIARRRHAELVVACRYIPEVYLRPAPTKMLAKTDNLKDFAPHFIQRLIENHVPPWLKRVNTPGVENFVVYEILPAKVDQSGAAEFSPDGMISNNK